MNDPAPDLDPAQRLTRAGLRPTRQRLGLVRLLFAAGHRHVSAEALHGEAEAAGLSVSLATVYNTLNALTAAGLLREVVVEGGRTSFDTNTDDHHHFWDGARGELRDIPAAEIAFGPLPRPPAGYRIAGVTLLLRLEPEDGGA